MKKFFSCWLIAAIFVSLASVLKANDWQIIDVGGKEYLSLDNVAQFYQLKNTGEPGSSHVVLGDTRPRIETVTNNRELLVNGVKEWLAFPTVAQGGQVLISRFDLAKTVEPSLRPTMIGNLAPFQTVVLDAGHGGQDGGGTSAYGMEKTYTLDVINDLKQALERRGFNVILTRHDDAYLALEQRAELANTVPNAVFVSVHFNSGDASAAGLEVYAMSPRGSASTADHAVTLDQFLQMPGNDFDDASLALANCVHHALLGNLDVADRGVRRARFAVLRLTHAPAILVEGGFLTNSQDSASINNPAWRRQLADAVASGVRSYQGVAQYKEPPKLLADYRSERTAALAATPTTIRPVRPMSQIMAVSNSRLTRQPVFSRLASRARQH